MPDAMDMDLVREFARSHSEAAFTELVQRHLPLVYSVARRYTGNDGDAQDVAQAVFIILARKAAALRENTLLPGWLYETTRFTATRLLRADIRRRGREQEAYMQSTLNESGTTSDWEQLSPHLESAMARLGERDRALLVLRFYQNKTGPEVAVLMGIRENTLHKRAARALDKLRIILAKKGVILSGEAVAGAISAGSIQAAPAGLAKIISAVAIAKGATASLSTSTLIKGALKVMAWTKAKTAITAGVVALLVTGTTTLVIVKHQHQIRPAGSRLVKGTNPGDFAPGKVAFLTQMGLVKSTVIPAVMQYAKEHNDNIPASMADLQSYLPPDTNGINYDNWEILATGKFTPQLGRRTTVLLQQKSVPAGQYLNRRIVAYTDGHIEASH